jgi:hypothetical protein
MTYTYVVLYNELPVAVAHTITDIEDMLAEYTKGTLVKYEAFNPKYPDDFQGWYTYKENGGEEVRFKLYVVDYK